MIKLNEGRKLLKISVIFDKNTNTYSLTNDGDNKFFYGDVDTFRMFLKRYKFIDSSDNPLSKRIVTYKQLAEDITNGNINKLVIWSNFWNLIKFKTIYK